MSLINFFRNNKDLLEMAKIDKEDYEDLALSIWVDEYGNYRKTKHNEPRIKITNNYNDNMKDLISVRMSKDGLIVVGRVKVSESDLNKTLKFINKNYSIFLDRFNNKITTKEMFKLLDENNT